MSHHQIAIYARVSSDKQAQDATIESQLAASKEFAVAHGFHIDDDLVFADNRVSGTGARHVPSLMHSETKQPRVRSTGCRFSTLID